jgi:hypothetical protein
MVKVSIGNKFLSVEVSDAVMTVAFPPLLIHSVDPLIELPIPASQQSQPNASSTT